MKDYGDISTCRERQIGGGARKKLAKQPQWSRPRKWKWEWSEVGLEIKEVRHLKILSTGKTNKFDQELSIIKKSTIISMSVGTFSS